MMQPLEAVRGRLIHTTILDKYTNVKINPFPFCVQGNEQFFMVSCSSDNPKEKADQNLILKSIKHSTSPQKFNAELTFLLDGKEQNEKLAKAPTIARMLGVRLSKEPGTGRTFSETLFEDCGQNLLEYGKEKTMSVVDLSECAHQVVEAIEFAHRHKVYHGDIRPEKIFVNSARKVKVVDFGGALFLSAGKTAATEQLLLGRRTMYWPPEKFAVLDSSLDNNERREQLCAFDVYGWGMTFYQLIAKRSAKELEGENVLYKQSEESYAGFVKVLDDVASLYKKQSTYMAYFDLLFRKSLEFDRSKRIKAEMLYNLSRSRSGLTFKSEATKVEEKKALLNKREERHKNLCYCCMNELNTVIKGLIGCNHKVCTACIQKVIYKTIVKPETPLQFECCLCKVVSKIKEIILQCGCPCDIEAIRRANGLKVLAFSKDRRRLCTAFCTNGHELTETEAFLVFGNSKLLFRNSGIGKELSVVISDSLAGFRLVEAVDLGQNLIDAECLDLLVTPMSEMRVLTSLYLDRNPIGPDGGRILASLLEGAESLATLVLGSVQGNGRHVPAGAQRNSECGHGSAQVYLYCCSVRGVE